MSPSKRTTSRAKRPDDFAATVTEAAKTAGSAVDGAAEAVGLSERVEANPYGMVAGALAVGYIAGGGLFTPTTARLLQLGLRLASVPFVRTQLLDLAESAVDGVLQQTRKMGEK